jgi:hypothetical protein
MTHLESSADRLVARHHHLMEKIRRKEMQLMQISQLETS